MKIIENNYINANDSESVKEENKHNFPIRITCEECESVFDFEEEDVEYLDYGLGYVKCPCCGNLNDLGEEFEKTLTEDNVEFPKHFSRTVSNKETCKHIPDDEVESYLKRTIKWMKEEGIKDFAGHIVGDLFIAVKYMEDYNNYDVYVSRDFYSTIINQI